MAPTVYIMHLKFFSSLQSSLFGYRNIKSNGVFFLPFPPSPLPNHKKNCLGGFANECIISDGTSIYMLGNGKIGHVNQGNNMYLFPGLVCT